jgi:uncharacterized protein YaaR (DUF327 family)
MLKIDDSSAAGLAGAAAFKPARPAKTGSKKNERPKKLFSAFLKKQRPDVSGVLFAADPSVPAFEGLPAEEALASLLDSVYDAGDALSKRPFPDEIRRYRSTIRNFMRYVLDNAYGVKEDEGIPNYLKAGFNGERYRRDPELRKAKNRYSTVSVIDQKLDRLAADIMTGQVKQLDLLKSIEEINGLLVDLLG